MPFALYEYDFAYAAFFSAATRALARAQSPMLSQVHFGELSGPLGSRVRTREGMDVVLEPGEAISEVTNDLSAVRTGNYEELYVELEKASDAMAQSVVGLLVQNMAKVTDATGNVVDAGGRPPSFELLYDALEKIDFTVDENDELVMPALYMHPDTAKKWEALPPLTPEQEAKLDDLKIRKREEALARRRRRRLS